jgi:Bifunctional DNA primase/polymerase, N-terminal
MARARTPVRCRGRDAETAAVPVRPEPFRRNEAQTTMWPSRISLEGTPLPIFPCRANKRPACPHSYQQAAIHPDDIAELFRRYPGPLIGVPTGSASGIDVVDIDPRHGGDRWLAKHRDRIPQTRTHETPSGGLHLLFRHTVGLRCSAGRIAPGVDVRSTGGYVIWWPAQLCRVLVEGPSTEWPEWLLDLARPRSRFATTATTSIEKRGDGPQMTGVVAERIPKPLYFEVLRLVSLSDTVTRHHQRRVIGILSTVTTRREYRNNALNVAAFCFRELIEAGVVSRAAAESLLLGAAEVCGYIAKDGDAAAMATIRSGLGSAIGGPSSFFVDAQEVLGGEY